MEANLDPLQHQKLFHDNPSLLHHLQQPGGFIEQIFNSTGLDVSNTLAQVMDPVYDETFGFPTRLNKCLPFWEKVIKPPPHIIEGLKAGFELPWNVPREEIPDLHARHCHYTQDQLIAGNNHIQRALRLHILRSRTGPGRINLLPFFIPKDVTNPDILKRERMLIDGSPLSASLKDMPFIMDRLMDFALVLEVGDKSIGFDVSDAYFTIWLKSVEFEFLCFQFPDTQGTMQYYHYTVIPQGIKSSGFLFENVMTPIRACISSWTGCPAFSCLDDFRLRSQTLADSDTQGNHIATLTFGIAVCAGLPLSWTKSWPDGTSIFPITGHVISTDKNVSISFTSKRWAKMNAVTDHLLSTPALTPRLLAQQGGGIQSGYNVWPTCRLHLRGIYKTLTEELHRGWDGKFYIPRSNPAIQDLLHWQKLLHQPMIARILNRQLPIELPVNCEGFTDAGDRAVGGIIRDVTITPSELTTALSNHKLGRGKVGFTTKGREGIIAAEMRTAANLLPEQQEESSTLRELIAILHFISTFDWRIRQATVRLFVDNMGVVAILRNGSKSEPCQRMAIKIDDALTALQTILLTIWIPRHLNVPADALSKTVDIADSFLRRSTFVNLCKAFNFQPQVDLFATSENRQLDCPLFVSRFYQPGCDDVDALSFNWSTKYQRIYMFPPTNILTQVLVQMRRTPSIQCLVIFPLWVGRSHMSILFPDGKHFTHQVKAYRFLERGKDIKRGPVGKPGYLNTPYTGHKFMFLAILWQSDDWNPPRAPLPYPPRSQYRHRFCIIRHFNGNCHECINSEPRSSILGIEGPASI